MDNVYILPGKFDHIALYVLPYCHLSPNMFAKYR